LLLSVEFQHRIEQNVLAGGVYRQLSGATDYAFGGSVPRAILLGEAQGSLVSPPKRVPIFDGHNDALLRLHMRGKEGTAAAFLKGEDKGHLDLPKARKGGFAGGLFAIFVPSPKRKEPVAAETSPQDAKGEAGQVIGNDPAPPAVDMAEAQRVTFAMASLMFRIERESKSRVRVCRDVGDIETCLAENALAAVLHIEGAEAIDANFEVLDVLHAAGLRSLGPVWSRPNAFGYGVPFRCPSSPDTGPGLTELGKELIRACNRLRILVDLSHLNERGFWDVAAISNAPLVATHSNAHAISAHSRNLTDRQLAAIGKSGGLAGVNFAASFLRPDGHHDRSTPIELIIRHIEHMLEQAGEDNVGIGSDFDGAMIPAEIGNAGGLQKVVQAMRKRGLREPLIEKVCYRNWLRVLARTWGGV
jgi:membrane dipeptidase